MFWGQPHVFVLHRSGDDVYYSACALCGMYETNRDYLAAHKAVQYDD